ncbi:hypothetical protein TYRP_011848 [Tyrophagus putrescentiae]|nr:hypothetical protein TYRP_011848 [Tyrophagus putrescentiae]
MVMRMRMRIFIDKEEEEEEEEEVLKTHLLPCIQTCSPTQVSTIRRQLSVSCSALSQYFATRESRSAARANIAPRSQSREGIIRGRTVTPAVEGRQKATPSSVELTQTGAPSEVKVVRLPPPPPPPASK